MANQIVKGDRVQTAQPFQFAALLTQAAKNDAPSDPDAPEEIQPSPEELEALRLAAEAETINKLRKAAIAEGFEEGWAKGLSESRAQGEIEIAQLTQLLQSTHLALESLEEQVANHLRDLALDLARQVIRTEIHLNPACILAAARESIDKMATLHRHAQVQVSPTSLSLMKTHLGEEIHQCGFTLVADAHLGPGDLVIKAPQGDLDAKVSTRWKKVSSTLSVEEKPYTEAIELLSPGET